VPRVAILLDDLDFNTSKVRLEEGRKRRLTCPLRLFQYLKGAIGSTRLSIQSHPPSGFQYLKGAIGSFLAYEREELEDAFQYLKGAIGSRRSA